MIWNTGKDSRHDESGGDDSDVCVGDNFLVYTCA